MFTFVLCFESVPIGKLVAKWGMTRRSRARTVSSGGGFKRVLVVWQWGWRMVVLVVLVVCFFVGVDCGYDGFRKESHTLLRVAA